MDVMGGGEQQATHYAKHLTLLPRAGLKGAEGVAAAALCHSHNKLAL
jgi:hypothetical protein